MSNYSFETVDVPSGSYIAWGPTPGQVVTGKVLEYSPAGETDFNGNPCPGLTLELVEAAYSVNKAGERHDHGVGDLVTVTCGLANLKRAVQAAALSAGDIVRLSYTGQGQSANGTFKVFEVAVARGAGRNTQTQTQAQPQQSAPAPQQGMTPPF